MKLVTILILLFIFISSCASVNQSPYAFLRSQGQEVIAFMPPRVSIAPVKNVTLQDLEDQERKESMNFQLEMHTWFSNLKKHNRFYLNIQELNVTNAKLKQAGYFDGKPMSTVEICSTLGVDKIVVSNYSLSNPMSVEAASALKLHYWWRGKTNNAAVTLKIYDKEKNKLLWMYNHKVRGRIKSTMSDIVDEVLVKASNKQAL